MDVLGAVASTVQLLNQVVHTIQSIRNVPTRIRVQGQILKELLIIGEEIQKNKLLQVESVKSILEELQGTIKSIQKRLPSSRTDGKKILRHWQSVKYYFKEDDVLALMQSLEPAKTSLLICIANEQVNSAGRSSANMEDIRMTVNHIQKTLFEASNAPLEEPKTVSSLTKHRQEPLTFRTSLSRRPFRLLPRRLRRQRPEPLSSIVNPRHLPDPLFHSPLPPSPFTKLHMPPHGQQTATSILLPQHLDPHTPTSPLQAPPSR